MIQLKWTKLKITKIRTTKRDGRLLRVGKGCYSTPFPLKNSPTFLGGSRWGSLEVLDMNSILMSGSGQCHLKASASALKHSLSFSIIVKLLKSPFADFLSSFLQPLFWNLSVTAMDECPVTQNYNFTIAQWFQKCGACPLGGRQCHCKAGCGRGSMDKWKEKKIS